MGALDIGRVSVLGQGLLPAASGSLPQMRHAHRTVYFNLGANLPESGDRGGRLRRLAMPEMMPRRAEMSARSLVQAFGKVTRPKSETHIRH
jgi:hypothetical protein